MKLAAFAMAAALLIWPTASSARNLTPAQNEVYEAVMTAEILVGKCSQQSISRNVPRINEVTSEVGLVQSDFADERAGSTWDRLSAEMGELTDSDCAAYYKKMGPDGSGLLTIY
ncbi:hypothetical protein N7E70_007210 [Aminobacter sp. NyZ550]|uniref:hypothetical protein n=1 Tax=Aminobacter sp. NyZ550 TaxID=2979870 RepID=UPI0021D5F8F1|nr:hypothetical protein [Aminobacter sp. NyZ550]WAX96642.1 hypothetical protein N7E70_007210 [Aminobacter sp. NyZ550]